MEELRFYGLENFASDFLGWSYPEEFDVDYCIREGIYQYNDFAEDYIITLDSLQQYINRLSAEKTYVVVDVCCTGEIVIISCDNKLEIDYVRKLFWHRCCGNWC